ncbi:MAG: SET domain-containing protein [Ginsengibacter sp.]
MIKEYLQIKKTDTKGRGVFTETCIDKDTIIEESPVIVMSAEERIILDKTLLHDYIFIWGSLEDRCCMALGYVAVYNHSYESNCEYFMDFDNEIMQIKTIRKIDAGEELTVNYNGDWNNKKPVWFKTD